MILIRVLKLLIPFFYILLRVDCLTPSFGKLLNGDEIIQVNNKEIDDLNDFTVICNIIKSSLELKLAVIKKNESAINSIASLRRSNYTFKTYLTNSIERLMNKKTSIPRFRNSNQNDIEGEIHSKKIFKVDKQICENRFIKNSTSNYHKLKKFQKKFLLKKNLNFEAINQEHENLNDFLNFYCKSLDDNHVSVSKS